jgi:hypothetical protein
MLGWLAGKLAANDIEKTIRQLGAFSIGKRQEVARVVLADIARTQKELEEITDNSKAVNVILAQGDRGNQITQIGYNQGIRSYTHPGYPGYAAGVLIQQYAAGFNIQGKLGRSAAIRMQQSIMKWIAATLPEHELAAACRNLRGFANTHG